MKLEVQHSLGNGYSFFTSKLLFVIYNIGVSVVMPFHSV